MSKALPDLRCPAAEGDLIEGDIVEVIVGPSECRFLVHERVLQKTSAFFATALKKEWQEGQIRRIPLPEEDPELVKAYVYWMYSRKFPRAPNDARLTDQNHLARLYGLGERLMDDEFQDRVVDAMVAATRIDRRYPAQTSAKAIYDSTPRESPARKLVVNLHQQYGSGSWIGDVCHVKNTSFEFLVDLSKALLNNRD